MFTYEGEGDLQCFFARIPLFPGLTTEQMLLKDMKVASEGDLKLAVSVIYMTLEVHLNYSLCDTSQGYTYYWWIITWFKYYHVPSSTAVCHLTMHMFHLGIIYSLTSDLN